MNPTPPPGISQEILDRQVPRFVQLTSPVSTSQTDLPLNVIALITTYLDDLKDIARLCRASRLLYYMCLPNLYKTVHLHSYADIRYVNGRPEGYGGGSPFFAALDGLVTGKHAEQVEEFGVFGEWREQGEQDFRVGRVPDNTMMLNTLLRAATDKMTKLAKFTWQLDCKPLKTLYHGLATHRTLTCLTLQFPSSRVPRPSVTIPPMPNLRYLKVSDIDPLAYPDDISLLLLHAQKLQDLRMHFSPRMRRDAEPSVNLDTYFGRLRKANQTLKLKHFGLQNCFAQNLDAFQFLGNPNYPKSLTFLDCFGGIGVRGGTPPTVFVDNSWTNIPLTAKPDWTVQRLNEVGHQHVRMLQNNRSKLERMYFISPNQGCADGSPAQGNPITPTETLEHDVEMQQLGRDYLHTLTRDHGPSLKHLLLRSEWAYTPDDISDIVRCCPNLEQLGVSVTAFNSSALRLLVPFLPKLKAFRALVNGCSAVDWITASDEDRIEAISIDLGRLGPSPLSWLGVGGRIYQVGAFYRHLREDGNVEVRREVTVVPREAVQHLEIWSYERLDLDMEPIAPFAP